MRSSALILQDIIAISPKEWDKIAEIYTSYGARHAKNYIYRKHGIKVQNREIREVLAIEENPGAIICQQIHQLAWKCAGWNGREW